MKVKVLNQRHAFDSIIQKYKLRRNFQDEIAASLSVPDWLMLVLHWLCTNKLVVGGTGWDWVMLKCIEMPNDNIS